MQNAPRIDRIGGEAHFLSFLPVRRWIMHEISIQKDNMFLWLPVFLAIGIGLYFLLPFEPPLALCVFIEIIAIFTVLSVKSPGNRTFVLGAFAFFLISSGVLAGKVRTDITYTPMLVKNIAAIAALLGTIAYMLLAGATVPTQRATLMTAIVFLAIILNRNPFSLRLVAVSAFVILLHSPESLMSASFHMSYAAVACLIYFYECTREYWVAAYRKQGWYQGLTLYFIGVCVTTIIASIATAPFSLYHFGQVSFIGSVANLVAVPLLAFIIMPFALIGFLAMALGLEYWPLQVMGIGITQMLEISYWASSLPAAIVRSGAWPFAAFLLMVCSCLFMILWQGWGKVCALPFLALSIFWIQAQKQPSVLISASHKLFAVQSHGDLYTSSRRSERFVLRQWEKYFGLAEQSAQLLPYKGERKYHDHPFINCGEEGCRFTIHGKNVSIIRNNYILEQECHWADVVISPDKIGKKQCADTVTIGKFNTWEEGAHAIFLSDNRITIETVAQTSSNRPWSPYNSQFIRNH